MIRCVLLALSCLFAGTGSGHAIDLKGHLVPGGIAIGQSAAGATVLLGDMPVKVGPDGLFVIGFGRDQGPTQQLTIIYPDGHADQGILTIAPRSFDVQRIEKLDQNMVTPDPATEARIKADQEAVSEARREPSERQGFLQVFIWPVTGPISGVYGSQRILNGVPKAPHFGTDIAAPEGTPVLAPADGVVRLARTDLYLTGGTIILDHGYGIYTSYLHLSALDVVPGQQVHQGDPLGLIGQTGRATGPHLHWGLNWNNIRLDPALLVPPMPPAAP